MARMVAGDPVWRPAAHLRLLLSHSPREQVERALHLACRAPHPAVRVDAPTCVDVVRVGALYADLPYDALLVLVADVERLGLTPSAAVRSEQVTVSDLAGWDAVVLLGAGDRLIDASRGLEAWTAGRITYIVRTEYLAQQLAAQLHCAAFRAALGPGPNAPWLRGMEATIEQLPPRTRLALRQLRALGPQASVKRLAVLAGVSRRQLERQFAAVGLVSPAEFVERIVGAYLENFAYP